MVRVFIFFYSCFLLSHHLFGQLVDVNLGARQMAIAGASVTVEDTWGIMNNVGSLGRTEGTNVGISYISRFGVTEISSVAFAGIHNIEGIGTLGVVASRFGEVFSEQNVGIGFSNQFGLVSLGASLNYVELSIEGLGRSGAAVINFGGVAEVMPELLFGAHVYNINQGRIQGQQDFTLPIIMKSGVSYRPDDDIMMNIEVEKELEISVIYKLGLEYRIKDIFFMRGGFRTSPFVATAGLGMIYKKMNFDYGYGHRDLLGSIHEITLGYALFD